ncbi:MAG: hypothetical protein MUP64_11330, partial [Anaerolineae bacterium]|nr:hypothetical protein [Anaerolineae bacterium]
ANEVLERVQGYAEVSPSGTGIKVFAKTNLDGSRTKKEVGVELYKDGVIDQAEFDRELQIIENQLKTAAPGLPPKLVPGIMTVLR